MISYKILSKKLSSKQRTELLDDHLRADDPEFKRKLFERLYARLKFTKGCNVRIVNTSKRGIVTKVYTDLNSIKWDKDKPFFIEVCLDDGQQVVCSPYDLTRKRA